MKCSLCGADLLPGNNTCPRCGGINTPEVTNDNVEMPQMAPDNNKNNSGIVDLDDGPVEVVQASADMSAPKLEVEQENLTSGAKDISNADSASTYDPTQEVPTDNKDINVPKEAQVNFQLPEVKEATQDTQGMDILQVDTNVPTVGEEVPKGKKKFSLKILNIKTFSRRFVVIAVVIALLIGGVIGSLVFGKQVYTPGITNNKTTKVTIKHVADGKNNVTYVGKYTYKIPDAYDYDKSDGGVVIYGGSDEFRILIKSISGNYEQIANAKESIKKSLEVADITVASIVETVLNENRYVAIEGTYGPRNRLYAFTQGNYEDIFYIEIVASDNKFDYDALALADDIINNVERNEKYSTMESIQYEDVSKIVVRAADAYING